MKKSLALIIALIFVVSFATLALAESKKATAAAQTAMEVIKGKITSIDDKTSTIVIKDSKGQEKSIVVTAKDLASLKVDQEVKVKCKAGSNVAESVKIMPKAKQTEKPKK